jgi:hypothetical protein
VLHSSFPQLLLKQRRIILMGLLRVFVFLIVTALMTHWVTIASLPSPEPPKPAQPVKTARFLRKVLDQHEYLEKRVKEEGILYGSPMKNLFKNNQTQPNHAQKSVDSHEKRPRMTKLHITYPSSNSTKGVNGFHVRR